MPRPPEALGTPQDFGDNAGQGVDQIPDLQDRLSRAAAEQDFISRKLDLDQQFAGDPDYASAPQRYRQALLQGLNGTSEGVAAPAQRAGFQQQMSRVAAAGVDSIFRRSVAKARDAGRASIAQAASTAVNDALRTTDEADNNPIFYALNDRIQASLEAGYLSPEEAVALRKNTARSYVSERGWRLADADPQQAVDTLQPTDTGADGAPVFAKTGDWRDFLDQGERASMVQRAQQNLDLQQRAAGIEALRQQRQQRQQQKADTDAAQAIAARYVAPLAADPTSVDVGALARERFPDSQQDTRQALLGAAQTAIAQTGDEAATGYGPGFWQAFNHVTAADGDPDKIGDLATLLKLAGPVGNGALTMTGVQQLQRFLDQNKTVAGRAQSAMEQNFLRQAHAQITGTEAAADPAAEARFQNFLGAYFPALKDGLASGKSAMQLFSTASSDYLGKLIPAFTPAARTILPEAASEERAVSSGIFPLSRYIGQKRRIERGPSEMGLDWSAGIPTETWRLMQIPGRILSGEITPEDVSPEDTLAIAMMALGKTPAAGSGKGIAKAFEARGATTDAHAASIAREATGATPEAADEIAKGEQAAPGVTSEAGAAPPSATTPAPQGNTAAATGLSWVSRVPSAEEVRAPFQAADEPAAEALIKKLRPIVQLPKYDELKKRTSGVFLTSDGRIIEWTSGDADAYDNYISASHPEGKSALLMRRDGLPYGIVFHNNPRGTCGYCNSHLQTLFPEGAKLWTVPPADAKAPSKRWIAIPKLYTGNSAQPSAPGETR